MIVGMTLFAINVETMVEKALVYVFFFWETESMRAILSKNLTSHKKRNGLTSIIYALTLGVIIFLLVTLSLQVQTATRKNSTAGVDLYLSKHMGINATETDSILRKYKGNIQDFAYLTSELQNYQNEPSEFKVADRANMGTHDLHAMAMSPSSLIDNAFELISFDHRSTRTGLSAVD